MMFDVDQVERGLVGSLAGLAGTPAFLASSMFAGTVVWVESTESTNTLALEAAARGVECGVWVADELTAGRGRGGHTWVSLPGDGLYVSVLMRPRLRGVDVLKISLAAGVACAVAMDTVTAFPVCLRWPNDLMEGGPDGMGRKLGGILTETAMGGDGELQCAVVGIGINLNQREMPEKLRGVATSLRMLLGEETRREELLPVLLRELEREVGLVESEALGSQGGPTHRDGAAMNGARMLVGVLGRFEEWSPMVRGMRVRVAEEGGYTGVTEGLEETGLLRVRLEDGTVRVVRHGGVRAA